MSEFAIHQNSDQYRLEKALVRAQDPDKVELLITTPGVNIEPKPDVKLRNTVEVMTGRVKKVRLKLKGKLVFHSIVFAPITAGSTISVNLPEINYKERQTSIEISITGGKDTDSTLGVIEETKQQIRSLLVKQFIWSQIS